MRFLKFIPLLALASLGFISKHEALYGAAAYRPFSSGTIVTSSIAAPSLVYTNESMRANNTDGGISGLVSFYFYSNTNPVSMNGPYGTTGGTNGDGLPTNYIYSVSGTATAPTTIDAGTPGLAGGGVANNWSFQVIVAKSGVPSLPSAPAKSFYPDGGFNYDWWVTQTGTGDGSGEAVPASINWLNTSANWGTTAGKINPGNTIHLMGTITTNIFARGSGTAAKPITFLFESNANINMPALPSTGAIYTGGNNYLTIDGGVNGLIQATDNGAESDFQTNSIGIYGLPTVGDITVKNLTLTNIFTRIQNDSDTSNPLGIYFYGAMTNMSVFNCHVANVNWAIVLNYAPGNSGNFQVYSNHISTINIGVYIGDGNDDAQINGVSVHHNDIRGFETWDNPANAYHHDGIFLASGNHNGNYMSNFWVFNNWVSGTASTHMTADITCQGYGVEFKGYLYNNILQRENSSGEGYIYLDGDTDILVANNTMYAAPGVSPDGIFLTRVTNCVSTNNIIAYCWPQSAYNMDVNTVNFQSDYNCVFSNKFKVGTTYYTPAAWIALGNDAHSSTNNPLLISPPSGDFNLNASSPARASGVDLTSYFTNDFTGYTRSAPWDMGAVKYTPE
jgi:hypothetical protein